MLVEVIVINVYVHVHVYVYVYVYVVEITYCTTVAAVEMGLLCHHHCMLVAQFSCFFISRFDSWLQGVKTDWR